MPGSSPSLVPTGHRRRCSGGRRWWGLRVALPPPPGLAAPASEFSADRAMKHVRAIASKPHPAGSPEAAAARDYILTELGLLGIPAEIQNGAGLYQRNSFRLSPGKTENVAARIKGTGGGRALLTLRSL